MPRLSHASSRPRHPVSPPNEVIFDEAERALAQVPDFDWEWDLDDILDDVLAPGHSLSPFDRHFYLDELVEMEVDEPRSRSAAARRPARGASRPGAPQAQRQQTVIDLTEEPDSPELIQPQLTLPPLPSAAAAVAAVSIGHNRPRNLDHLHRRRQMPHPRRSPPGLGRGDGANLRRGAVSRAGATVGAAVIDLTDDSLDDVVEVARRPTRNRNRDGNGGPAPRRDGGAGPHLVGSLLGAAGRFTFPNGFFNLFSRIVPDRDVQYVDVRGPNEHGVNNPHQNVPAVAFGADLNPLGENMPRINYGFHPYQRAETPKAPHVAPPAPAPGFTRNLKEDVLVVCPSCGDELKYDEDKEEDQNKSSPKKTTRTKSKAARAEHHFWAVRACGHVFCRSCYENRRKLARPGADEGFVISDGTRGTKVLCAVKDCNTDVSTKTAWVGLFL